MDGDLVFLLACVGAIAIFVLVIRGLRRGRRAPRVQVVSASSRSKGGGARGNVVNVHVHNAPKKGRRK